MTDLSPEVERHLYEKVLERIKELMGAEPGTPEGAELDFLVDVAEGYEERNFPMGKKQ